jgi:hypothetical protein
MHSGFSGIEHAGPFTGKLFCFRELHKGAGYDPDWKPICVDPYVPLLGKLEVRVMKATRDLVLSCCVAILALTLTVAFPVRADLSDRMTIFTFSQPVEIPGGKVLPAGTYVFKVLDTLGDRNIVQIFDKDRRTLFATVLTIPDYRPNPTDKAVITFAETAGGGPVAIKEWFYPGESYGNEFVYPKARAMEIAKNSNQSVPSMPTDMSSNISQATNNSPDANVQAMQSAPLKAEEQNGDEVEVAEVFIIQVPVAVPVIVTAPLGTQSAKQLPQTASILPLLGLTGLVLFAVGTLLWIASKRAV